MKLEKKLRKENQLSPPYIKYFTFPINFLQRTYEELVLQGIAMRHYVEILDMIMRG